MRADNGQVPIYKNKRLHNCLELIAIASLDVLLIWNRVISPISLLDAQPLGTPRLHSLLLLLLHSLGLLLTPHFIQMLVVARQ